MAIKIIESAARERMEASPLDLGAWEQLWVCVIKQQELSKAKCEFAEEGYILTD